MDQPSDWSQYIDRITIKNKDQHERDERGSTEVDESSLYPTNYCYRGTMNDLRLPDDIERNTSRVDQPDRGFRSLKYLFLNTPNPHGSPRTSRHPGT